MPVHNVGVLIREQLYRLFRRIEFNNCVLAKLLLVPLRLLLSLLLYL